MIAAIDDGEALHIVRWTGRVRLHAGVITYCSKEADAAVGVMQVPDSVFTQGLAFTIQGGDKRKPCPKCRLSMQASVG